MWDADGVAEVSFLLRRQWLFPLWHQPPGERSPVDVWVDRRVLEEGLLLSCIVIGQFEEPFERPDPGMFFLEKLNDCFLFPLVGGGGVRW